MEIKTKSFSDEHVRSILTKKKNQFRELIDRNLDDYELETLVHEKFGVFSFAPARGKLTNGEIIVENPPFKINEKIKVKEPWAEYGESVHYKASATIGDLKWLKESGVEWQSAESMPLEYSRLTIRITGISVQRVQSICATDALAEGISETEFWQPKSLNEKPFEEKWWDDFHFWSHYPQMAFANWWKENEGDFSWDKNKWVWVYRFNQVKD